MDWHAPDDDGNVWYFVEESIDFEYDEQGNLSGMSSEGWEAESTALGRESSCWLIQWSASATTRTTFGTFPNREERSASQRREEAVAQLQQRLGEGVRIVHGGGRALVGNFACSSENCCCHYGSGLQRFGEALRLLVALSAGEAREWAEGGGGETGVEQALR